MKTLLKCFLQCVFLFLVSASQMTYQAQIMELTSLVVVDADFMLAVSGHKCQNFQQIMC